MRSELKIYVPLLLLGVRVSNVNTAISPEIANFYGSERVQPKKIYEALENFGEEMENGLIRMPDSNAQVVAVDVYVAEKFGKRLGMRYNSMRGRPTKTIPILTYAGIDGHHADPMMFKVLENAGERGSTLIREAFPILEGTDVRNLVFDGEFIDKDLSRDLSLMNLGFVGRLKANTNLAKALKPFLTVEGELNWLEICNEEWGGKVTVFGFLRSKRRIYYVSNLDIHPLRLREIAASRWKIENLFRDCNFLREFPGCNTTKVQAHVFLSFVISRLTEFFRATAKTIRLILSSVRYILSDEHRILAHFGKLPARFIEKIKNFLERLRRLGIIGNLKVIW